MKQSTKRNLTSKQLKVGVIVGGTPEELNDAICSAHEVSKSLEKLGKHVEIITFDDKFEMAVKYARIDVAFIIDSTYLGKTRTRANLRDVLRKLKIPYTGSKSKPVLITKNKVLSKKYFAKGHLLTPPYIEANMKNFSNLKSLLTNKMKPPFVIKPRDEGAGMDVSFVETVDKMIESAKKLLKKYKNLIIEKYIDGIELTVPVLEKEGKPLALAVIEVEKRVKVLSNDVKSLIQFSPQKEGEKVVKYYVPARIDKDIYQRALQNTIIAHEIIGCKGYSRVDMIVDKTGNIFVLEINSLPTLSEYGLFTKAAKLKNISYDDLIDSIVQSALNY